MDNTAAMAHPMDVIQKEARDIGAEKRARGTWEQGPNGFSDFQEGDAKASGDAPIISSAKDLKTEVFPPIKSAVKGYLVEGATILAGRQR